MSRWTNTSAASICGREFEIGYFHESNWWNSVGKKNFDSILFTVSSLCFSDSHSHSLSPQVVWFMSRCFLITEESLWGLVLFKNWLRDVGSVNALGDVAKLGSWERLDISEGWMVAINSLVWSLHSVAWWQIQILIESYLPSGMIVDGKRTLTLDNPLQKE